MFTLLLILLIFGVSIGVGLFVGSLFVQAYIYSEPSPHMTWGAPVTGAALFLFYTFWCLIVVFAGSTTKDIPYDVIWRFSPAVDKVANPVKELTALRKGGKKEAYKLHKWSPFAGSTRSDYRSVKDSKPWNGDGVEAIVIAFDDGEMRFVPILEKNREQGAYLQFVTTDGWAMTVYDNGPTGLPRKFRFGRFFVNAFLNVFHFALWFVCLWLLVRYQWSHALVGAFALWLACTLILMMLLEYAASVSEARQVPAPAAARMQNEELRLQNPNC